MPEFILSAALSRKGLAMTNRRLLTQALRGPRRFLSLGDRPDRYETAGTTEFGPSIRNAGSRLACLFNLH